MKRKIIALLQARTDSTRLPAKVLKLVLGVPLIIHQLTRINQSKTIDELILVTSEESSDDKLVEIVSDANFSVFRGSKNNVLERFFQCAKTLNLEYGDIIVRLTGDCPVHDAAIIDELVNVFLNSHVDYMANCINPIYPDGLDVEVFTFEALQKASYEAKKLSEQEHVTPYIRDSGLFKVANLIKEPKYPEWRLTVDEPDDFTVIEKIYDHFQTNTFSFEDIVHYLENHPEILAINSNINRNEGYLKSLQNDIISKTPNLNNVYLKPLSPELLEEKYLSWMNDPEIVQFTESRWKSYTMDDLVNYVKGINNSKYDFMYGIYLNENNKYIGNIKIGNINPHHGFAELGIILGDKSEWGKGYATVAIKLAIQTAFDELGLNKLTAGAYENNVASIKALTKAGFTLCGVYKNHCQFQDHRVNTVMLEIENNTIKEKLL